MREAPERLSLPAELICKWPRSPRAMDRRAEKGRQLNKRERTALTLLPKLRLATGMPIFSCYNDFCNTKQNHSYLQSTAFPTLHFNKKFSIKYNMFWKTPKVRTLYYHRQKKRSTCNYLDIGGLRLPTLVWHLPITCLISS